MSRIYSYTPSGVCSRRIEIETDDSGEIIKSIHFIGGCSGNTQGVAKLAAGRSAEELIGLLSGIDCGGKGTSCPDQLARALVQIKKQKENSGI